MSLSLMEGNDKLCSKRGTELDPDLLVDVLGNAEADEVEFAGLRGVGEWEAPREAHLDV